MSSSMKAKERAKAIRTYRHLVRNAKKSNTVVDFQRYMERAQKIKEEFNL
jgi:hypothetical protein